MGIIILHRESMLILQKSSFTKRSLKSQKHNLLMEVVEIAKNWVDLYHRKNNLRYRKALIASLIECISA